MAAETASTLSDEQRLAWLRLIRSDNVGPITFRDLIDRFGTASAALDALPDLARRAGRRIRICSIEQAEGEIDAIGTLGARLVGVGEPDYPPWLARIDSAQPVITIHGDGSVLAKPMIAIVGSRNASVSGRKMAANIASALGRAGLIVASGLARGIDSAAHEGAILTGTVAVFAGGLDRIYPAQNVPLAERIVAEGGVQMSETQLGLDPRARDFPRRNRIVSGLSMGVVVIEAAERSGSLITARLAGEQGRTVFAVPGSPLDPRAAGTNRLLKEGAMLVTGADDIIAEVEPMLATPSAEPERVMREAEIPPPIIDHSEAAPSRVVEALGPSPIEIDEIIRFTGLSPAEVQLALVELDLAGRLERHPGQRVSLI